MQEACGPQPSSHCRLEIGAGQRPGGLVPKPMHDMKCCWAPLLPMQPATSTIAQPADQASRAALSTELHSQASARGRIRRSAQAVTARSAGLNVHESFSAWRWQLLAAHNAAPNRSWYVGSKEYSLDAKEHLHFLKQASTDK
jgi:hypothetical protein